MPFVWYESKEVSLNWKFTSRILKRERGEDVQCNVFFPFSPNIPMIDLQMLNLYINYPNICKVLKNIRNTEKTEKRLIFFIHGFKPG